MIANPLGIRPIRCTLGPELAIARVVHHDRVHVERIDEDEVVFEASSFARGRYEHPVEFEHEIHVERPVDPGRAPDRLEHPERFVARRLVRVSHHAVPVPAVPDLHDEAERDRTYRRPFGAFFVCGGCCATYRHASNASSGRRRCISRRASSRRFHSGACLPETTGRPSP